MGVLLDALPVDNLQTLPVVVLSGFYPASIRMGPQVRTTKCPRDSRAPRDFRTDNVRVITAFFKRKFDAIVSKRPWTYNEPYGSEGPLALSRSARARPGPGAAQTPRDDRYGAALKAGHPNRSPHLQRTSPGFPGAIGRS